MVTMLRVFVIYKPLRFFLLLAAATAAPALLVILRFLYFYAMDEGQGHIQSLTLSVALMAIAGVLAVGGVLADLLATNRILLEDIRRRLLVAEIRAADEASRHAR